MTKGAEITDDAFLGGGLQVLQPAQEYRAAMDAVLLAAAIPVQPGESVLDMGTGVGVVSMCIARRVPGARLTGLEIQTDLVELARQNIERNKLNDIEILEGDVRDAPRSLLRNSFDFVCTNPPYYGIEEGHVPPSESKRRSHTHAGDAALAGWIKASVKFVKPLGRFTIVFPADGMAEVLSVMGEQLGDLTIFPFWPRSGQSAKRVIITGRKGASGPVHLRQGLTLHAPPERYSKEAEDVLRLGKAIDLNE